ncbi:MAG TPA: hypothetical protein VF701_06555 [Thermoanaerobaculia bacterium]
MSPTGTSVELLARAIVNRLEDRGVLEFRDAEAAILLVAKALEENFSAVEAIEREARTRAGAKASQQQVEDEMRRIAVERKFIL